MKIKPNDLLLRIGLTAILIFTPITYGGVRVWSIAPVLLLVNFLVFLWLWRVNNTGQSGNGIALKTTSLDKPILIFVILVGISFIFSIYKHDSFCALVVLLGYVGIYYLIVNNYSKGMRRYLTALIISVAAGLSIYGLLQYFGVLPHPWWKPKVFLAATYVNHNHFAGYLELAIPLTIGALIHYKSLSVALRLLIFGSLVAMAAAFIFSQSRGAWLSLGAAVFTMNAVLVKNKTLKKSSILILTLVIALVFTFAFFKSSFIAERLNTFASVIEGEASPATRIKMWRGTVDMIRQNPLIGTGIGTYIWGFPRYRPEGLLALVDFAHNDYLHMAAEMGLLAPIVMIWMLILIIKKGLLNKNKHSVVIGMAAGVLSLSLHGLVDFNFHISANMILFTLYAALIAREGE